MTKVSITVKAKDPTEAAELLQSLVAVVESTKPGSAYEHNFELVHRDGEAFVMIEQDKESYNGVKINCCG